MSTSASRPREESRGGVPRAPGRGGGQRPAGGPGRLAGRLRVGLLVLVVALPFLLLVVGPTSRDSGHRTLYGAYPGFAESAIISASISRVEDETGVPVQYAHEFLDHRYGWGQIEGSDSRLDAWASWVTARPGRRLVLSVPMLPGDDDGSSGPWSHPDAYDFAGLANGSHLRHFEALATRLQARPALRDTVVRLGWEFNGDSWPWSPGEVPDGNVRGAVEDWKIGWNRAASAMNAIAPGLQFEWCPALGYDALWGFDLADLYPGDAQVDYVGVGAYDYALGETGLTEEQRWRRNLERPNGLNAVAKFAHAHGKPLARTEWGLWPSSGYAGQEGGGDSPYYLEKTAEWFERHEVAYSVYNQAWPHSLSLYPRSRQRYRELFGG